MREHTRNLSSNILESNEELPVACRTPALKQIPQDRICSVFSRKVREREGRGETPHVKDLPFCTASVLKSIGLHKTLGLTRSGTDAGGSRQVHVEGPGPRSSGSGQTKEIIVIHDEVCHNGDASQALREWDLLWGHLQGWHFHLSYFVKSSNIS